MMPQTAPNKFVPHKVLKDGGIWFSVPTGEIIHCRVIIKKVIVLTDEKGAPKLAPDGNKIYGIYSENVLTILTKEEWDVQQKTEDFQ